MYHVCMTSTCCLCSFCTQQFNIHLYVETECSKLLCNILQVVFTLFRLRLLSLSLSRDISLDMHLSLIKVITSSLIMVYFVYMSH